MSAVKTEARLPDSKSALLDTPIEFISNEQFETAGPDDFMTLKSGATIYSDRDDEQLDIDGCGDFDLLRDLPLLSPAGEEFLFLKMNYLLYQAECLRQQLCAQKSVSRKALQRLEALLEDADAARNHIAECNLRLVISISRRFSAGAIDFDELVSEGNEILLKAISKFDVSRGFRFSTYTTHAVQRHFYRYIQRRQRRSAMERRSPAEILTEVPRPETDELIAQWIEEEERMSALVTRMAERLDEREHQIVIGRFGLNAEGVSLTLRELAVELSLSKERVRQLQMSAIDKLRDLFDDLGPEFASAL